MSNGPVYVTDQLHLSSAHTHTHTCTRTDRHTMTRTHAATNIMQHYNAITRPSINRLNR